MRLATRRLVPWLIAATLAPASVTRSDAQSAREPAFEVASIKENKSGAPYVGGPGDRFSDGRFQSTNVPLRLLMRQAFERSREDDLIGGPGWLDTDRWDVTALAESATADMLPMIRTLVIERFGLKYHIDTKRGSIYELVPAKKERRLGAALRQAAGPRYSLGSNGSITGRAVTMRELARLVGSAVRRQVADRTGLTGTYDVDLRWAPALAVNTPDPAPGDSPDIFTAIQEQLGLKLQPSQGPVEVMVIDSVARPTEN